MSATIRISREHLGHSNGSASHTFLISSRPRAFTTGSRKSCGMDYGRSKGKSENYRNWTHYLEARACRLLYKPIFGNINMSGKERVSYAR